MNKKRNRILSGLLCAVMMPLGQIPVLAQETAVQSDPVQQDSYEIYPVPHSLIYKEENGNRISFRVSDSVNVVYDDTIDQYTKNYLDEILENSGLEKTVSSQIEQGKTNILLGTNGSGGYVDTWYKDIDLNADLFSKTDAYALNIDREGNTSVVAILGKDTDASFYALSTLEYLFSSFEDSRLLAADIQDYSNGELRGFIEGFYGEFDYEERESQMKFLRRVKGNMYVFASKSDPYHGGNQWQNLYPQEELNQIQHLVEVGKENKVRYVWSFHTGKSRFLDNVTADPASSDTAGYAAYQQRVAVVKQKFQQLYDIGVRDFHILNDDYNSGSHKDICLFLNEMNAWLKEKGDCGPLVFCPKAYAIYLDDGSELATYKQYLDNDIYLYWTGAQVNSPIEQSDIDFVYERSGHEIINWINYPCSEHDKSGVYLGDLSHYMTNADQIQHSRGLMSNPVDLPEANKVAYFQLMSWLWNNDSYSSYMTDLWEKCFKYIEPEVADSYLTIARNISSCADSYRYDGFPESEYIKEALEHVEKKITDGQDITQDTETNALYDEFKHILAAISEFRTNCTNAKLVSELDCWLNSLQAIVTTAIEDIDCARALCQNDVQNAWKHFSSASRSLPLWDSYTHVLFPEKKAKAGSRRIQPFASQVTAWLGGRLLPELDPDYEGFSPGVLTSLPVNGNTSKMMDGDEETAAVWQKQQAVGDYFGLDCGRVINVHDITILQGESDTDHDYFHEYVLEYSADGTTWTEIPTEANLRRIEKDSLDVQARYVRLRVTGFDNPDLPSKKDYWTKVREFTINKKSESNVSIYTDLENLSGPTISSTDATYTLTGLGGVSLPAGSYVGIELQNAEFITGLEGSLPEGLKAEYSIDGVNWSDAAIEDKVSARFARIINPTAQAVSLAADSSLIAGRGTGAAPSVSVENIPTVKEGCWDNIIDGDISTYVWTSVNQAAGQSITVDLGRQIDASSVSLYMSENRPRLYHGKIYTSCDNTNWKEIMEVDASNDITVIDGDKRKARAVTDGSAIRYVKIEITDSAKEETTEHSAYLQLYEVQINDAPLPDDIPSLFSGTTASETAPFAADGNLTTFFSPAQGESSGTLEYVISKNNGRESMTIIQDAELICHAKAEVLTDGSEGWQTAGTLDQPVTILPMPKDQNVYKVRISWDADHPQPHLYEIMMTSSKAKTPSAERVNLALNQTAASSSDEVAGSWGAAGAVDGNKEDINSRWSSGRMRNGNEEQTPQHLIIDLGTEDNTISQIVTSFYLKAYGTDFDILVSDDQQTWTAIAQHRGFESSSKLTNPVDTFDLETPVKARYVKLLFHAMNTQAAGTGVSVREVEIFGTRKTAESAIDASLLELALEKAQSLEIRDLQAGDAQKAALEKARTDGQTALNKAESQRAVDTAASALNEALLEIRLIPAAERLADL